MQAALRISSASGRCCGRKASNDARALLKIQPFVAVNRRSTLGPVRAQPEQQSPPKPVGQDEDLPPWVRKEKERELQAKQGFTGLPWPLYLLFSTFTAIAAIGSIFEFNDRNPLFGVLPPDNPLWAPILLLFAVTGIPTSGYLFIKGVNGFNEEQERQDKIDGFL